MAEACALATRIAVLDAGVVVQFDTPKAMLMSADPRVRALLEPLLEVRSLLP
jgi:ABC-type proline/glycine betaine transport system ATPase subunit